MPYETAWQKIVDTISEKYDLEIVEKDSGYIRTAWKNNRRVSIRVSREPLQIKVRVERQKYNGWTNAWEDWGTDEKKEREILEVLQGRLG
jgi:hypothetical protein